MHGKGFAMNAKVLSVLVIVSIVSLSSGCYNFKEMLHGNGAYCGSCAVGGQAYTVAPANPGPYYGGPSVGTHGGCGGPACVPSEPVCGTEYGGAYCGGYDAGYPIDGNIIGSPAMGTGVYGMPSYDQYSQSDSWVPQDPNYVPGTLSVSDGSPVAPLQPIAPMGAPTPMQP